MSQSNKAIQVFKPASHAAGLFGLFLGGISFAPLAQAAPREPAPIVYANRAAPGTLTAALSAQPPQKAAPANVEFRYPDQKSNPENTFSARDEVKRDTSGQGAFQPLANPGYDATGIGAVYPDEFDGLPTANGEILDLNEMTAAHPSLPLPSLVQVINLDNGKEIVVRVNDRGPFEPGSLIELSQRAGEVLAFPPQGRANVRVRYLGPAPALKSAASAQTLEIKSLQPRTPVLKLGNRPTNQPPRSKRETAPTTPPSPSLAPQNPQPPAIVAPPKGMDGYYIQAGSFSKITNAQRLRANLQEQFPADIVKARVRGTDYFRVLIGPLIDRPAATRLRDHLARQGLADGFVLAP